MKLQLSEIKRMQQLAGLLTEDKEQLDEATTYLTIKDSLTSAMESMGYKIRTGENDTFATIYTTLEYEKPIDDNNVLVAMVAPYIKGKINQSEKPSESDYNIILVEMFILQDKEVEDKKFFGMMKTKKTYKSSNYVINVTTLDLSEKSTEGAINEIINLFKQGEEKSNNI
jgi:hypothetical protein